MLQFVCDYCGNIKEPREVWINGVAAENVGTQAARREVLIDPAWRYERAVLPLAVHFCCEDCKEQYLAQLFQKPASLLEVDSVTVEPITGVRTVRASKKSVTNVKRQVTRSRGKRVH